MVSRSFSRSFNKYVMSRKVCPICNQHPVAINYYRHNKTYYRTACTPCIHKKRRITSIPSWIKSGYKKKEKCDRCGFKFKLPDQSNVYYIDGNDRNTNWANLKTICLNCQSEVAKTHWKPGTLTPDF